MDGVLKDVGEYHCIIIEYSKPLGSHYPLRNWHLPGMESLKRAAISRPPRGRGGASVLSRGEASLTSGGGDGRGIDMIIATQAMIDYRRRRRIGRREKPV